ncbi:MAG: hypothetical protein JNL18_16530 [Planctomycetaceae bacterium]|nr:hypothetical protein [Planctomycetaceae bacterium]
MHDATPPFSRCRFSAIGCRTAAVCRYWMAFDAAADRLRSYNSSVELHALLPSVTIEFANSALD